MSGHRVILGLLGSGRGSNAEAIISAIESGQIQAQAGLLVSDVADAGILEIARKHGVPAAYLPPGKLRARLEPEVEAQLVDLLRSARVDLVALAGFMRIVGPPLLDAFPRRIINIHPSLLPKFPGLAAWQQALEAGETETGCTVHFVDHGVDTGEIIAQAKTPIFPDDTPASLHRRIQALEHRLYPEVLGKLALE